MREVTLADITLSITDGKHGDCEGQDDSGYYFISCKDVKDGRVLYEQARQITESDFLDAHKRTRLEPNDILITNSGTIGRMAFIRDCAETGRTTFQKSVAIIKPNTTQVLPKYLYYQLQTCVDQFINQSNGSAQKNLLLSTMRAFNLSIHNDFILQRRIADILSAYDDLIENNQKQIKLLEEAAQRLYREWFVDLRFPGHETTPIVDGVPEGWEKTIMETICESVGGGTPSTKNDEYYRNGTIRWVTPTDITRKSGLFLLEPEKRITEEGLCNSSAKMLPPYTILMTSRASVGYFGLCEHEVCTNQGFISCIPRKAVTRFYLLYNLMARVDEIRAKASGSTFLEISKKTFRELLILLPDEHVLEAFNGQVQPIVAQMEKLTKSISQLQEARDRLLPKLMSGEVEV
ncbi:MAG: restriction endonuclease subunit S [Clostridia bacterium]|nr:restriction endonuclease subunit S [Clostridia bacterium]